MARITISKINKITRTILLLCIIVCPSAWAQQRAQYTQYIMNNYVLNPASGGINNYWDLKAGFRNQWTGFAGSPKTMFVSINGPIGFPDKRVRNSHLRAHHGVGAYIFRDASGPLSMTGAYLSYSYHIKLSDHWTASAGAFMGMLQYRLENSQLIFVQTPDDPSLADGQITRILPDAKVGIWIHSNHFFMGLAVDQIFNNRTKITIDPNSEGRLAYHYFLTLGYKIKLNEQLDLIPSTMLKYTNAAPLQTDVNVRMKYRNAFTMGFSYRREDAFAILVGYLHNNKYDIGYSYDLTTSKLRASSWGTHEIIVGMNFAGVNPKKRRTLCPMDYWN